MLGVGEDDGFAGVNFGGLVNESPKHVETAGRVDGAYAPRLSEELAHHLVEHGPFDLRQELLGGNLLAVGVLDFLVFGEGSEAGADARDHEICTGDTHFPQRVYTFADDLPQFGLNVVFVVTDGYRLQTRSRNKENTGGK